MRTRRALAGGLLLAACGEGRQIDTAGTRLETAALAAGLIPDPGKVALTGLWRRDTDQLCVVGPVGTVQRIGVVVDYGPGQGCTARGTVRRTGDRLEVALGGCRFPARFDGERIGFPAKLPAKCEAFCRGRASLAALEVEQSSIIAADATILRGQDGQRLCGT